MRSAYFTVMLAELESAAETVLKLETSAAKTAAAIRPRRPVEGVEVFIVISQLGFKHAADAMRPKAGVHETGPKVGEGWVKTGEAG